MKLICLKLNRIFIPQNKILSITFHKHSIFEEFKTYTF